MPDPDGDRLVRAVAGAADRHGAAVVAVTRQGTTSVHCTGLADPARGLPADQRTRFEIGSLTKTFTVLLFAVLVAEGRVDLHEPLVRHLPADTLPADPDAQRITAYHLATHTSGLPHHPPRLRPWNLPVLTTNPYSRYQREHLFAHLSRARLSHPPGTATAYSNLAVGLLGHLIEDAAGDTYGNLLREKVLTPLDLTDTTGDPALPQALGHWHGRPRPPNRVPAIPAAGGLRSSAHDLTRYLHHLIEPGADLPRPLRSALHIVLHPPADPGTPLIWHTRTVHGRALYSHPGGTRGHSAFIGFCPRAAVTVVALTSNGHTRKSTFIRDSRRLLRHHAST
ncbi:serine hydrolase domain-containing protein [Actinomadura rubrisoli]|uniref:Class A beta-lactamase-related serine hydrolase n=1 Tax=Actinomadura rubrisoli TaxID=2530368 RepID=A0A4R5C4L4_9ACTN|nr:serine hydrolase domain-containing protein [Actinomadura rubrisoli]TDD94641.1 class A beta-lactamase-related serine hydrolase [Actinomadura rubrisoli]